MSDLKGEISELSDRLDRMGNRLEAVYLLLAKSRPSDWLTPKEAAEEMSLKTTTIYDYIKKGVFLLGPELKIIGPKSARNPTYRINVAAYYTRTEEEQTPLAG